MIRFKAFRYYKHYPSGEGPTFIPREYELIPSQYDAALSIEDFVCFEFYQHGEKTFKLWGRDRGGHEKEWLVLNEDVDATREAIFGKENDS